MDLSRNFCCLFGLLRVQYGVRDLLNQRADGAHAEEDPYLVDLDHPPVRLQAEVSERSNVP